jgi:hypothetical protein
MTRRNKRSSPLPQRRRQPIKERDVKCTDEVFLVDDGDSSVVSRIAMSVVFICFLFLALITGASPISPCTLASHTLISDFSIFYIHGGRTWMSPYLIHSQCIETTRASPWCSLPWCRETQSSREAARCRDAGIKPVNQGFVTGLNSDRRGRKSITIHIYIMITTTILSFYIDRTC